jgi:hypothetical protein
MNSCSRRSWFELTTTAHVRDPVAVEVPDLHLLSAGRVEPRRLGYPAGRRLIVAEEQGCRGASSDLTHGPERQGAIAVWGAPGHVDARIPAREGPECVETAVRVRIEGEAAAIVPRVPELLFGRGHEPEQIIIAITVDIAELEVTRQRPNRPWRGLFVWLQRACFPIDDAHALVAPTHTQPSIDDDHVERALRRAQHPSPRRPRRRAGSRSTSCSPRRHSRRAACPPSPRIRRELDARRGLTEQSIRAGFGGHERSRDDERGGRAWFDRRLARPLRRRHVDQHLRRDLAVATRELEGQGRQELA